MIRRGKPKPDTPVTSPGPKTAYGAWLLELAKKAEAFKVEFDEAVSQEVDSESDNHSSELYDIARYLKRLSEAHERRAAMGEREITKLNKAIATLREEAQATVRGDSLLTQMVSDV